MVQRKVPNKIGIKSHLLKLDTHLVNLKPSSQSSSSQAHEKMKKIMKKSRSIKLPDDSPSKQSPNYMKSTSSSEARKEQSPAKTPTSKISRNSKTHESASGIKGSRSSSLKIARSLTKTPSFKKPLRCSKKAVLCEDYDAQRATCSSTLKESKFPNHLQLNDGGRELDGTSAMKVCPYSYCSLNGHRHAPVQPLKCFLAARRRALKTQKGFKLGCLSPRQTKKSDVKELVILDAEEVDMNENRDLFNDIDWEEGCCFDSGKDGLKLQGIDAGVDEEKTEKKTSDEILYTEHEGLLYDEETVSSGFWSDEDGDSASDSSCEQMNYDSFDVSSASEESDTYDKMDEFQDLKVGDESLNFQKEEASHEPETVPDYAEKSKDGVEKNHTTIIYNIIQFNISVFVNGGKTDDSEMGNSVIVKEPASSVETNEMETEEAVEEQEMSDEDDELNQIGADEDIRSTDQLNSMETQGNPEQELKEFQEPETGSDVNQTHGTDVIVSETDIKTESFCKKIESNDNLPDPSINLRDLARIKKSREQVGDDLKEFNPRGPNFLPEAREPDAETVDLRHQMMDERKNTEEWMVDFALQQAVTTLAPARKRKVALLVEAFEKVMPPPVPVYETHNRHISKAFTHSRPMQACS